MNEEAMFVQHRRTHGSSEGMTEGISLALTLLSRTWHLSSLAHFPSDVLLHRLLPSLLHPGGWGRGERPYVSAESFLFTYLALACKWPTFAALESPSMPPLIPALNQISLQASAAPCWKRLICYVLLCHHPVPVPQKRSDLMARQQPCSVPYQYLCQGHFLAGCCHHGPPWTPTPPSA